MSLEPSVPPPPYDFKESPNVDNTGGSSRSTNVHGQTPQAPPTSVSASPLPSNPPSTLACYAALRSHQPIGIYNVNFSDFYLSLSAETIPLNHVSIASWGGPNVSIHRDGSPASPVLATAGFNVWWTNATLQIAPATIRHRAITETMDKSSFFGSSWGLNVFVPSSGRPERFEWRYSSGAEVGALGGRTRGLKMVRVGTGEVVVAFAWTVMSARKMGKFRWCSNEWYGEEGDLLVLVSLLAVVEYIRRQQGSHMPG